MELTVRAEDLKPGDMILDDGGFVSPSFIGSTVIAVTEEFHSCRLTLKKGEGFVLPNAKPHVSHFDLAREFKIERQ